MARIGGVSFMYVDGEQLPVRGNVTVGPTSMERTGVAGLDGMHGHIETRVVQYIEADISTIPEVSATDLSDLTDGTVMIETATKVYVLRNAYLAGRREINGGEGTMRVRYEGFDMDEFNSNE